MTHRRSLNRADIVALFTDLADELAAHDERASLFVVGGAAMSLAFDDRRSTNDVDAAFEPSAAVRRAASSVAARRELSEDWLNDGAKGFMPGNDSAAKIIFERPSLRVEIASPEYLLAMKVMSARVEQDTDDILILYRILGLRTVEEGLDIASRHYGAVGMQSMLRPHSSYLLETVVELLRAPESNAPAVSTDD